MSFRQITLGEIAEYSKNKCGIEEVTVNNYISTENMLPNKGGVVESSGLPSSKTVSQYRTNNILISNIRPYFKKIWYADKVGGASNDVLILDINKEMADTKYAYYTLTQDKFFDYMMQTSKGTKMPRGDKLAILNFDILLPSLKEQKTIAKILSDLDNKIEVNNKINKNLEEMAQAIFKQWFIDFEFPNEEGKPYKSSGGEMVESELGMLPKQWEALELSKLVDVVDNRGKTPPLEKERTQYPIIDVKALSNEFRVIDYNNCSKFVSEKTYENWFRSGHPAEGDILMSTVGSLAELKIFYGGVGCIAQNVVALRSKGISHFYLYQYLRHIKGLLVSYNIGSVQPSIKITHVIKQKIIKPNDEILDKFNEIMEGINLRIFSNAKENEKLSQLRDTLLPKLMSGEIRVPINE